jgi:hypothetical protein
MYLLTIVALLVVTIIEAASTVNNCTIGSKKLKLVVTSTILILSLDGLRHRKDGHSTPYIKRTRRPVHTIFQELGPIYARRAYRMHEDDFWHLHRLLLPYLGR